MIPFALIGFGGGSSPVPLGVKKYFMGTYNGGVMYVLMNNGDLYVSSNYNGNGLGYDESSAFIRSTGWSLTNSGCTDMWQGGGDQVLVRKGPNHYECTAPSQPSLPCGTAPNNDWHVIPESYYIKDGYNIFDDIAYLRTGHVLTNNGSLYSFNQTQITPVVTDNPVSRFYKSEGGNLVWIENNGVVRYTGARGLESVSGSGASTDNLSAVQIGASFSDWTDAICAQGQVRDGGGSGTGAEPIAVVFLRRANGTWYGCGSTSKAGMSVSAPGGIQEMTDVPPTADLYVTNMFSQNIPTLNWRRGLQTYIVDRENEVYKSSGMQNGAYSLFRNLATGTNSTTPAEVDPDIISAGGIEEVYVSTNLAVVLKSKDGRLWWAGRGVNNTSSPVGYRVTSAYKGDLSEGLPA